MKTLLYTLCDGAFNYGGRITVVGTYDQILMTEIPGVAKANFALRFLASREELGQTANLRVEFRDANDNPVSESMSRSVPIPETGSNSIHLALAGSAQLNVAEAGMHKMVCYINDIEVENLDFAIIVQ